MPQRVMSLLALLVLFALTPIAGRPAPVAAEAVPDLTGSWIVAIVQPGPPLPPGLDTFTADGNVLVTTPQLTNSLGHGQWVRTGPGEFLFTFIVLRRDEDGNFLGLIKVLSTAVLDETGDNFTGEFVTYLIDPEGVILREITGLSHGTRIAVEPLPVK